MSETQFGSVLLSIGIIVGIAHTLGYIFEYFRQPRLVGEILTGIIIGPYILGNISPLLFDSLSNIYSSSNGSKEIVFNFLYSLGVTLLMFLAGSGVRNLLSHKNLRATIWLLTIGTPLPFLIVLALGFSGLIPMDSLVGEKNVELSALLVLASASTITSIPVISRIFLDLGILKTRFASLILGTAVLEDIALWGVLAVASAYASSNPIEGLSGNNTAEILLFNVLFLLLALAVMPRILSKLRKSRWNIIYKKSAIAYSIIVLAFYITIATLMQTNLIFASFLAGFGLVGGIRGNERKHFKFALSNISNIAFAIFIPVYFALVGYRLVLDSTFSLSMLLTFLVGTSALTMFSVMLAARLAGFKKLDVLNIAITNNARGGPGIVLASIAYESGIISSTFYTTLVLSALITSQLAGFWLGFVLKKGWPLLTESKN